MSAAKDGRFTRDKKRILDDIARQRRDRKALEALEQDNFQTDPHENLTLSKHLPKFSDTLETKSRRKQGRGADYLKAKSRRSFAQLVEEDEINRNSGEDANYSSARAKPSKFPARKFCAVCGFISAYKCVSCGIQYCCIKCLGVHTDTRCLKWTS